VITPQASRVDQHRLGHTIMVGRLLHLIFTIACPSPPKMPQPIDSPAATSYLRLVYIRIRIRLNSPAFHEVISRNKPDLDRPRSAHPSYSHLRMHPCPSLLSYTARQRVPDTCPCKTRPSLISPSLSSQVAKLIRPQKRK
jgi:hypothetical protein